MAQLRKCSVWGDLSRHIPCLLASHWTKQNQQANGETLWSLVFIASLTESRLWDHLSGGVW